MATLPIPSRGRVSEGERPGRGIRIPGVEVPSVQPSRDPGIAVPAGAFDSGGAGLEAAGAALADLAVDLQKIQEEDDEREAKRLDNEYSESLRKIMFGDEESPGYYSQKGEVAVSGFKPTKESIESLRNDFASRASNERVKEMFDEVARKRQQSELNTAVRHMDRERQIANDQTSEARIANAGNDAAARANDPDAVQQYIATARAEVNEIAARKGWSPEIREQKLGEVTTNIYKGVLNSLLVHDPQGAESYYNTIKGEIDGTARDDIEAVFKRTRDERLRIAQAEVKAGLKDEIASLQRTGTRAGVVSDDQIKEAFPERAGDIIGSLQAEQDVYVARERVALTSPEEDDAILRSFAPQGEGFAEEAERQDTVLRAIVGKRKALAQDPAGYVAGVSPEVAEGIVRSDPDAIASSLTMQERMGVPRHARRALPKSVTADLTGRFTAAADGQAKADLAGGLAEQYGEYWPMVYGEMVQSGLPSSTAVLAGMTRPGQARARVAMAEAMDFGETEYRKQLPKENVDDVDEAVSTALGDFEQTLAKTPGGERVFRQFSNGARLLAYKYVWEGTEPSAAAQRAAADLVNDYYNFRGTYRVPGEFDPDVVEASLEFNMGVVAEMDLAAPASLDPRMSDKDRREQHRAAVVDKGYFITNPDETGVYLVDEQDRPVLTADGALVEFLFVDMKVTPEALRPETSSPAQAMP